ncbi:hypothetical protein Ahy_A09g043245 [Arachis hypogaea]|uniref:Protein FAR1-RELATED SEQUENCE n=1 Tax=Arachis hypogaea TaxID=3818 RepID=A0A445BHW1_ARAHY|nr:hypothetical protein Ahy_A09g043245 [Arachis hypogaea]
MPKNLGKTGTIFSQSMVSEATSGFKVIEISIRIIFMLIYFFPKACTVFGSPQLINSVRFAELYEDRHIWILVCLDHHFWAGMRSTQKSESIHSFLNKFIAQNSSLRQFVKQYDNFLTSREQAEREFNAVDFHTVIPCATKSAIEAQF